MQKCQKPNLFLIGVQKGGTTNLAYLIGQHPEIYVPSIKEPRYFHFINKEPNWNNPIFSKQIVFKSEKYIELFSYSGEKQYAVDATPSYFKDKTALTEIANFNPYAKFILLLRDPVERLYAHFLYSKMQGFEAPNTVLEDAINTLEVAYPNNFVRKRTYLETGLYAKHLKEFYQIFDKNKLLIVTSEEFFTQPQIVLDRIFDFLLIDRFVPNFSLSPKAASGEIQPSFKAFLLQGLFTMRVLLPKGEFRKLMGKYWNRSKTNLLTKPPILEATKQKLVDYYSEDVSQLRELTGLSFQNWKNFTVKP